MNVLNKLCAIDRRRRTFALSLLLLLATAAALHRSAQHPPNALLVAPLAKPVVEAAPFFVEQLASKRHNVQTHAATLIELRDGRVRGFWSAGSREGAKDVRIDSAVYDPTTRKWSEQRAVVGRIQTQRALWRRIKKLGNPVVARLPSGALALFYVSVSVGGWSGSSLSVIVSDDDGATWRRARRLITSPFFNLATLVKGAPYQYADGGLGLPVYHELFAKFGEVLRLSPNALTVLDKRRLSAGADGGLQPVVLINDARNASALMRYAGQRPRRVLLTETADAARHWRAPVKTNLPNPDSAVAALVLPDGDWLAVVNPQERQRDQLALYLSRDRGQSWRQLYQLENQSEFNQTQFADRTARQTKFAEMLTTELPTLTDGALDPRYLASVQRTACRVNCRFRFSYPYLLRARNGDFHLAYSYNQAFIKHVTFNPAWLAQLISQLDARAQ